MSTHLNTGEGVNLYLDAYKAHRELLPVVAKFFNTLSKGCSYVDMVGVVIVEALSLTVFYNH